MHRSRNPIFSLSHSANVIRSGLYAVYVYYSCCFCYGLLHCEPRLVWRLARQVPIGQVRLLSKVGLPVHSKVCSSFPKRRLFLEA